MISWRSICLLIHGPTRSLSVGMDAVFIGGHGGQLEAMLRRIGDYLSPEGTIVFNSVSEESEKRFLEGIAAIGRPLRNRIRLVVDAHNPIEILQA